MEQFMSWTNIFTNSYRLYHWIIKRLLQIYKR